MLQGRVLVALRHSDMLGRVRGLLKSVFAVVVMVADEVSLIEASERIQPDLVVVDISMPVEEGVNIARRMKERFPGLRMIVLSDYDEATVVTLMQQTGVCGYVLKRTAATDLVPAVEAVLQGGRYVSPALHKPLEPNHGRT
jgi:DNA-binding NarL/FixJ family response regulator